MDPEQHPIDAPEQRVFHPAEVPFVTGPLTEPVPATPSRPARRRSWMSTAALALSLGIVAGGGAGAGAAALLTAAAPGASSAAASGSTAAVTGVVASTATDQSDAVVAAAHSVGPAVVVIQTGSAAGGVSGIGSGFVYDANGYILTNYHVISGASAISVTLADGRTFDGTVVQADASADLAIVKIDATGLPVAAIGSGSDLKVGQLVVAIGDPLGQFANTVTTGIVSGLDRQITAGDSPRNAEQLRGLIQTDAAINSGNSGGPLVNAAGQVVGINTATASNAQGLGFAIPIDAARSLMNAAMRTSA